MANLILIEDGWEDRVRNKLGVDVAYLSDADINQPDIIEVAEADIIDQIPNYLELTDSKRIWLEAAVVCYCAVLICQSLAARVPVKEQGPHFTADLSVDWDTKMMELENERDSYIGRVIDLDVLYHFTIS